MNWKVFLELQAKSTVYRLDAWGLAFTWLLENILNNVSWI